MSRVLTRFVLPLVVVIVLLVVADRVAAGYASRSVAEGLTRSQALAKPATVTFYDVPFLTQAAAGRYGTVVVTMDGLPTPEGLVVDQVDATLYGVTAPTRELLGGAVSTLPVERGEAVAFISFERLQAVARKNLGGTLSGITVGRAGADRVAMGATVKTPFGTFAVKGEVQLSVAKGAVVLRLLPQTLSGVPAAVRDQVAAMVDFSVLAPQLPFGFRASSVRLDAAGLWLEAAGSSLSIPL